MLLDIKHRTWYHYSMPVYLEPFTVRLRPRSDANQTLRRYNITVTPNPDGITHCIGLEGNNCETIWFGGLHDKLLIEVHTLVETHYDNPFNFLVTDPDALNLPLRYQPQLMPALAYYLTPYNEDSQLKLFAHEILQAAKNKTIPFLSLLAETIPKRFVYTLREHGEAWAPEETMRQGQGSCRDFAVLFVGVCRSVGVAARFVSGYCIDNEVAGSDMHAWAEVYLPGAGWRGFDPSRGLSTSDDYVVVATGQCPQDAAPTLGHFRGEAESSLVANIAMTILDNAAN